MPAEVLEEPEGVPPDKTPGFTAERVDGKRGSTEGECPMNNGNGNGLDLRTALLLLAGGLGTYIAFLHPAVGIALMVGIGVMTLLHLLLK